MRLLPVLISTAALCTLSVQAVTLDLNDKAALGDATHKAVSNLANLYKAQDAQKQTAEGALTQPDVSWFASGMMWNTVFDSSRLIGDRSNDVLIGTALAEASYKKEGDLLGGALRSFNEKLRGKWNDDILWYALAMIAGAEVYNPNTVMPGGASFIKVASLTFDQVIEQWDPATCNGGIYWSRDRDDPKRKNYKSTITHGEFMILTGRLTKVTGNATYAEWGVKSYEWLKSSGIITAAPELFIHDGANAPTCQDFTTTQWAYNFGTISAGLAYLADATKNPALMNDAKAIINANLPRFTNNNVLFEPACNVLQCSNDQQLLKAQLPKGLATVYRLTDDAALKTQIQTVLDATLTSALKNCDENFWCNRDWVNAAAPIPNDANQQLSTAELLLAVASVHGAEAPAAVKSGGLTLGPGGAAVVGGGPNGGTTGGTGKNGTTTDPKSTNGAFTPQSAVTTLALAAAAGVLAFVSV